ncbi:hypothetical protein IG631_06243 [Alternaria alternata]|nr:hypothetical protein IG631_06243 [Alternaria alternata]
MDKVSSVTVAGCEAQASLTGASSASRMPFLTSSSGLGLLCSPFSRLSAFMCISSSFWCPCRAGAALEAGRMLRSTSSARSGRELRPFLRLSVARWRSSSRALAWRALLQIGR